MSASLEGLERKSEMRWNVSLVCGLVLVAGVALQAAERPNVLLILTDDQGWGTLGCYGGTKVATPHLDRLAREGVKFSDAYVTSQCTPTRASLLTGQYTARHGLWHVLPWYGYPEARVTEPMFSEGLSREAFTLAKGLRAAGYRTGIVGKWHLTRNADGNPMGLKPEGAGYYGFDFAPPVLDRSAFAPGEDRGVELLTDQAIEFIGESKEEPWFCFLSHHMIHGVVVAPDEVVGKYRAKGFGDEGPDRAVYLAGLECIDRSVGRLMAALEESGEAEETLVVFLSDNGGIDEKLGFQALPVPNPERPEFPVSRREYDNAPLRAGKGSTYEGGTRVPMIVRWPGVAEAGREVGAPVHAVDFLPTFFEAAGAVEPGGYAVDGRSLVGVLGGEGEADLVDRPVFQYYPFYDLRWGLTPNASVRLGDYKLIEFFGDRVDAENRYVPGRRVELYNLREDLGESRNLVEVDRGRAEAMLGVLREWMEDVGAEVPAVNPRFAVERGFVETREKPAWLEGVRFEQ